MNPIPDGLSARRTTLKAALLLGLTVLGSWSCRPAAAQAGSEDARADTKPPIVIVSIDTLRSDHLPAYGYAGTSTPAIDRLRTDGILFERAFTNSPLTLPAHAALMTALLPADHGVRDNTGYRLANSHTTLAEVLRRHGYRTHGAISAMVLRAETGIARGFEDWDDDLTDPGRAGLGDVQRHGTETVRSVLAWIERADPRPFFSFVHLYEPHTPYRPPEPHASRHRSAYDGEIAAADAALGELLDGLDRAGLYDRALIVLLSDHGEGLGEHGEDEHGILLYRSVLQVPLIVKLPANRSAGASVATNVALVDVAPTVASIVGAPSPWQKKLSVVDLVHGKAPHRVLYAETLYPQLRFGWSGLVSVIDDDLHYIEGGGSELYDLATDPGEQQDLSTTRREAIARFGDLVAHYDASFSKPEGVDAETAAELAALGYLSSSRIADDSPRPSPRDRIQVLRPLRQAMDQLRSGHPQAAAESFRRVLATDPGILDAWQFLGMAYDQLGRVADAYQAYGRAFELSANTELLAPILAWRTFSLGRYQETLSYLEMLGPIDRPDLASLRAYALLETGNPTGALAAAREAASRWPGDPSVSDALGTVLSRVQDEH